LSAIKDGSAPALRSILTEEKSGIFSFDMLTMEFCNKLLEEIGYFEKWCSANGLTIERPNSMNNYGAILDDFGFYNILEEWVDQFITPFAKILWPHLADETFDTHHGFVVEYKIGKDIDLGFHVDDSEVTLNVCLGKEFTEGTLYFKGIRCNKHQQTEPKKEEYFEFTHRPGKAILHLGKHRHGANPIKSGERLNLILWCRSSSFRDNPHSSLHNSWCDWK